MTRARKPSNERTSKRVAAIAGRILAIEAEHPRMKNVCVISHPLKSNGNARVVLVGRNTSRRRIVPHANAVKAQNHQAKAGEEVNGITIADCRRVVGTFYRIRKDVLLGPAKPRWISRPRQMAMVLARELTPASTTQIGRHYQRDHTTVCYATRSVGKRVAASEVARQDMENFRLTLRTYQFQRGADA